MKDFYKLFLIEFKSLILTPSHYLGVVLFFIAAVSLIPFTLGTQSNQLKILSTPVIWMLFLLVVFLVIQNLFLSDLKSGLIEQIIVTGRSLTYWVLLKTAVYFLVIGLPLILISPLLAASLYFDTRYLADFYLILFLTAPILFFLVTISASFSAALGGNFIFLAMMSFPLCIPVLIVSSAALDTLVNGFNAAPLIKLLIAGIILTGIFCPWISGRILRVLFE